MLFRIVFISIPDKIDMNMEKQVTNFLFIFSWVRYMYVEIIKLKISHLFLTDVEMKTACIQNSIPLFLNI